MNYYIINEPCGAIRANARQLMNNNWIQVVLGVALYYVLLVMVPEFFQNCVSFGAITQWNGYLQQNQTISVIAAFYQMFFSGVFVAGLCSFLLYFINSLKGGLSNENHNKRKRHLCRECNRT